MSATAGLPDREPALPPKASDAGKDPMTAPAQPRTAPSRAAGTKQLTVWINAQIHLRMSRLKVETGQDLKSQVEEAMDSFLTAKGF